VLDSGALVASASSSSGATAAATSGGAQQQQQQQQQHHNTHLQHSLIKYDYVFDSALVFKIYPAVRVRVLGKSTNGHRKWSRVRRRHIGGTHFAPQPNPIPPSLLPSPFPPPSPIEQPAPAGSSKCCPLLMKFSVS